MNSRTLSVKIREYIYKFKQLQTPRKVTLGLLLLAVIVLIFGTIAVIGISVIEIEGKAKKEAIEQFNEQLYDFSGTLSDNLEEYGYDMLDEKLNAVEEGFLTFSDELAAIESNLDAIEIPLSSPINDNENE